MLPPTSVDLHLNEHSSNNGRTLFVQPILASPSAKSYVSLEPYTVLDTQRYEFCVSNISEMVKIGARICSMKIWVICSTFFGMIAG